MNTADRRLAPIVSWLGLCLALAYVPDMGHGFISDDFGWILHSRVQTLRDLTDLFTTAPMGFYRPLVSLSFLLNEPIAGLTPIAYGLVNLALVIATAAAVAALVQAIGLSRGPALFAAAVWAFNIHGIGMALTWVSGRTSLLATLFAVLAARACVQRQRWLAALWTLLALLAKEEPLLLPLVFFAWSFLDHRRVGAPAGAAFVGGWRASWHSGVAVAAYLGLRSVSGAMTPWNAPDYYRLSLSPSVLGPNLLEYADRAATFAVALVLLAFLALVRRVPRPAMFDAHERGVIVRGCLWTIFGYGVTITIPVRSDLYACLPSVGVALVAAAGGRALWRQLPAGRQGTTLVAGLVLPLVLVPVYRGRNVFARNDAILSTAVVRRAVAALQDRDDLTRIEVYQEVGEKPSVASALGGNLGAAIELGTGRHVSSAVQLTRPGDRWPAPDGHTLRLTVVGDEIAAVAPPQ